MLKPLVNLTSKKRIEKMIFENLAHHGFTNNPDLLGFQNGILDTKTMVIRDAKEDEYIVCTHDYPFEIKKQDECSDVMKRIQECFVDEQQMHFYLKHVSMSLSDQNKCTPILFCQGSSNLKEVEQNQIQLRGP